METLYLGGNQIGHVPDSIGAMQALIVLNLCDNRLRTLPRSISGLTRLKSLSLHNNLFCALPPDIIRLDLEELSLRNNPLVVRFVQDLTYDVPTLKELTARTIKLHRINYDHQSIPQCLIEYLNSAKSCLNPKCQGQTILFSLFFSMIIFLQVCTSKHVIKTSNSLISVANFTFHYFNFSVHLHVHLRRYVLRLVILKRWIVNSKKCFLVNCIE